MIVPLAIMTSEKPGIRSNLVKTLLIILGIVVAMLLSFGSRVIAFEPMETEKTRDKLLSKTEQAKDPAILLDFSYELSDELTKLFLNGFTKLK